MLAALAGYREALENLERGLPAFNEAEALWIALRKDYPDYVQIMGGLRYSSEEEIDSFFGSRGRRTWTPTEQRALRIVGEAAKRRLRKALAERDAARIACGFAAEEEKGRADTRALMGAEDVVVTTVPTTLAGASALLEFVHHQLVVEGDLDVAERGLESLRAFLQSAGGSHV